MAVIAGIAIAGLTADARKLASHMRSECLNHKFNYESPMISGRLVRDVADMHQWRTAPKPGGVEWVGTRRRAE